MLNHFEILWCFKRLNISRKCSVMPWFHQSQSDNLVTPSIPKQQFSHQLFNFLAELDFSQAGTAIKCSWVNPVDSRENVFIMKQYAVPECLNDNHFQPLKEHHILSMNSILQQLGSIISSPSQSSTNCNCEHSENASQEIVWMVEGVTMSCSDGQQNALFAIISSHSKSFIFSNHEHPTNAPWEISLTEVGIMMHHWSDEQPSYE